MAMAPGRRVGRGVYDGAMRIRRGIVAMLVLSACGKGSAGPDVTKMKPDEACRVIAKRAFECKDTIVKTVSASMKKAGAPDDVVARMATTLAQPLPCGQVDARELDPLLSFYDHDCSKLATCFEAIAADAMRPAGATSARSTPPAEPRVATPAAVEPAPAAVEPAPAAPGAPATP